MYRITKTEGECDYDGAWRDTDIFVGIFDKEDTDKFISALLKENFMFDPYFIGTGKVVLFRHEYNTSLCEKEEEDINDYDGEHDDDEDYDDEADYDDEDNCDDEDDYDKSVSFTIEPYHCISVEDAIKNFL